MNPTLAASLACALALTGPAWADIAPTDLWQAWQDMAQDGQAELTAEGMNREGGMLVLDRPLLRLSLGDEQLTITLSEARIEPEAGGNAVLVIPAGQRAELLLPDNQTAIFEIGGEGLRLTASGELPAPDYALASPSLVLALAEPVEGTASSIESANVAIGGLSGRLIGMGTGDPVTIEAAMDDMTSTVETFDPVNQIRNLSSSAQVDVGLSARIASITPGLADADIALGLDFGHGNSKNLMTMPAGEVETTTEAETGRLSLVAKQGLAALSTEAKALGVTVNSGILPVDPVELAMDGLAVDVSLPFVEAGKAALTVNLSELTAGEPVWAHFDPARALPRTPANLRLTAEADLIPTDPAVAGTIDGDATLPPVIPERLTIRDLTLDFAGMNLDASGEFAIDTTVLPDGFAQPAGQLDLTLVGGLALLERLTQAGLVRPEMAMGAQMMLGMFATRGEGDTLTSTIRTESDGGLTVNGTRLK